MRASATKLSIETNENAKQQRTPYKKSSQFMRCHGIFSTISLKLFALDDQNDIDRLR